MKKNQQKDSKGVRYPSFSFTGIARLSSMHTIIQTRQKIISGWFTPMSPYNIHIITHYDEEEEEEI